MGDFKKMFHINIFNIFFILIQKWMFFLKKKLKCYVSEFNGKILRITIVAEFLNL